MRSASVSEQKRWTMGRHRGAGAPSPTSSDAWLKESCELRQRPLQHLRPAHDGYDLPSTLELTPQIPGQHTDRVLLRDALISFVGLLLAFTAFDDITTDNATPFHGRVRHAPGMCGVVRVCGCAADSPRSSHARHAVAGCTAGGACGHTRNRCGHHARSVAGLRRDDRCVLVVSGARSNPHGVRLARRSAAQDFTSVARTSTGRARRCAPQEARAHPPVPAGAGRAAAPPGFQTAKASA